jgi:adenine C2-methylase RlmN of 23S rRNA A2503 and tRNA A37
LKEEPVASRKTKKTVAGRGDLTGTIQLRNDVRACLLDAIEIVLEIGRDDVQQDWKPSDKAIGSTNWNLTLANFATRIKTVRAAYAKYDHRPIYATRTISEKFSEIVFNAGYASPVRTPRGRDILAACGQLKSATEKLSARERLALRAMAMTD